MRRQSMMGSSKYEFDPHRLDKDIQANIKRYQDMKENIKGEILNNFKKDAARMDQIFSMYLEVLRELKDEYKL